MRGGGFKTVTGRRVAQVYVTRDKQMAALVGAVASLMHGRGDGKFAVLTVRIPGMQMRLDPEDSGGKSLIAQASIAPAQIRQIGRYRIIPAVLAEAKRLRKHKNDLYAEVRRKGGYRGMTADFAADMGWQSYMRDLGAAAGDRRIRSGTWYRQTHKAIAEEFYSPVFGDAVAAAENFAAVGE